MIKRCVTNSWMEKWSNSLQSSAVTCLKGQFIQTWNFSHHLLTWTWMEGQQKFRSQQNISGASQRNSAARFSLTAEIKCETAPHSLFREIQGSQSPDIPTYFEKKVFFFTPSGFWACAAVTGQKLQWRFHLLIEFGISGLLEVVIKPDGLHGASFLLLPVVFFFFFFF